MGRQGRQLLLLLWKNYLLQKRKVLVTVLEVGLPTLFAIILVFIRNRVIATEVRQPTTWPAYSVAALPDSLIPSFHGSFWWLANTPDVLDIYDGSVPTGPNSLWQLSYTPDTPLLKSVMADVQNKLKLIGLRPYAAEEEMVKDLTSSNSTGFENTLGGIVFYNVIKNQFHSNITYKIRLSASPRNSGSKSMMGNPFVKDTQWFTEFQFPLFQKVGPREKTRKWGGTPGYMREGFLPLQQAIDQAIIHHLNPNGSDRPMRVELQRFPYPPYNDDNFVLVLQQQFPLVLMLSFVFTALHIVKDVVHEKERRLKESMKMMGLSSWMHWTAWFIKSFFFLLISVAIMTLFFCIPASQYGSVVGYTSWSVILVFLLAYSIATINFCFAISVFFSKANSAAAAGGILFFVSYIPYFFLQYRYDTLSWGTKIGCCLISNVAMAFGGQVIGMAEGTGGGVQWSNIAQGVTVDDPFAMLQVIIMLLVDAVLYGLVTWYVEAVAPGEYGIPQPWYFPFTRTYWCGTQQKFSEEPPIIAKSQSENSVSEATPLLHAGSGESSQSSAALTAQNSEFIESEPRNLKAGVQIRRLRKEFGKGNEKKVAVEGMILTIYEGQITALLGHNGAGKTTTMSMLTGFIPPTSGTAIVNGYDILQDISSVRASLGICPQHDVLFDTLTVEEHLVFFAKLKGCESEHVQPEVDRFLAAVGLLDKRDSQARTLSGGMKRKLSVAIALIGGSKIVILDEPTSGMDPGARRHTWDILQRNREGRTLLLTTHFMDEADLLGDRIAIMVEGVVQCCGSSLFLKNKYGAGYHMIIVKAQDCNVDSITEIVKSHCPSARLEHNVSAELSYILPQESSHGFEKLFTELEERKEELKISSYGISVTTMEEVFLRVGEKAEVKNSSNDVNVSVQMETNCSVSMAMNRYLRNSNKNEGLFLYAKLYLYAQQFHAMFTKRVLHTWRNLLLTVSQLVVPLFFTIMGLIVIKTLPGPQDSPALPLTLYKLGNVYIPYASNVVSLNSTKEFLQVYGKQFSGSESQGIYLNESPKYKQNPNVSQFIVKVGSESLYKYTNDYPIALSISDTVKNRTETVITALFNDQAYHTPGITLSAVNNALLQYITKENFTLTTVNHPLPRQVKDKVNDDLTRDFEGFTIAFNAMFGMSFLASSFILFLIKERTIKAKHCQVVSGVNTFIYWISTFCWDFINFSIPALLLIVTFAGFNIEAYIGGGRWLYILLLFLLYGWAILPAMYLVSFIFKVPSSGFVWITMLNILAGVATLLAVNILQVPQLGTRDIATVLEWVFVAILPNFCLGQGLQDFYLNYQFLNVCDTKFVQELCLIPEIYNMSCCKGHCGEECADFQENYLAWEPRGIGRMLVFLACQGLAYFCLVFIIESNLPRQILYTLRGLCMHNLGNAMHRKASVDSQSHYNIQEDNDVVAERERISKTPVHQLLEKDALVMKNLTKYYEELLAVDCISVGIPKGECFGLLGVNGAGKTSTFKMLTGDETITSGNAYLAGFNVKSNLKQVQKRLGYCPQFDALIEQLTGRETLTMYARLRGMPSGDIKEHVQALIDILLLTPHADKLVASYSGGNKRKLSSAIALVGNPPIVFLDEPTTGMDPVARRHLWDALSQVRASGRTLILTSHSMEECEALCTKIAIMVNGQFKCLGSQQHLKAKFGEGYTLLAKVRYPGDGREPDIEPLRSFVEQAFPGSILKDVHQGMVHYHITNKDISWAQVFGTVERNKALYNIEDYSISQTTLEQVFLNFARAQHPPVEEMPGCRCCGLCSLLTCCWTRPQHVHVES